MSYLGSRWAVLARADHDRRQRPLQKTTDRTGAGQPSDMPSGKSSSGASLSASGAHTTKVHVRALERRRDMSLITRCALILLLSLGTAACGEGFDPVSDLRTLRAIGVAKNKSYANPGDEITRGHALSVGERTLCVFLTWHPSTTDGELATAAEILESIRAEPIGERVRITFTLPEGWDTG